MDYPILHAVPKLSKLLDQLLPDIAAFAITATVGIIFLVCMLAKGKCKDRW